MATPTPTPVPAATPIAAPSAVPVPTPTASPAEQPLPQPVAATQPVWQWIALGVGGTLALGLLGWFLLGRRRKLKPERPAPRRAAPVAAPSPPRPAPTPVPVAPPPPPEPFAVELRPQRVTLDTSEAALEFELVIANTSGAAADGVRITVALISANPMQDAWLGAFHANPPVQPATDPFDLPAGQAWGVQGRLPLVLQQIHVVEHGGRKMFVPLVLIDIRWRGGLSIRRHAADFMIGLNGEGGKLGPIWLDRRVHGGLAAQRYFAKPLAEAAAEMARA